MANILVMESVDSGVDDIRPALERMGHKVGVCRSNSEAREALQSRPYDLLITGLIARLDGRPVADGGLSLIAWVRALRSPVLSQIPIIAISSANRHKSLDHLLSTAAMLGATVGLLTPLDVAELRATVNHFTSLDVDG